MNIPRIVIAGSSSGVGKTSITCGIIHGMKKLGYSIQPFKVGPDYIDPSYLSIISGNDSMNLDAWLMGEQQLIKSFASNSKSDISVIEGVMGFYDGFSGDSNYSSTHHIATLLKSPVILILDAGKTARSIAATALGFKKFHKNSRIVSIILNKIGSEKHEKLCKQALLPLKIPIIGCIPKLPSLTLESRHLGLIPTLENNSLKQKIFKIASTVSDFLDIEKLIKISKNVSQIPKIKQNKNQNHKTTIAIALDKSFNFYYQDNINSLRQLGAKIKFFSPISDSKIPSCDGLYIGGGFPEILGSLLQKNSLMKKSIKKFAEDNLPIYAECGGLMYLTNSISYGDKKYKMIGLYDAETKMTKKMKLNYTKGTIIQNCLIGKTSSQFHGHEFHYSEVGSISNDSKFAYKLELGSGIKNQFDGMIEYNSLASYGHLYFSGSLFSKNFVNNCIKYSRR